MILHKYSSEAVVLAKKNFSEADKILVLMSKNYGKISLLAKGVRRPKSRKRGHLEVFSYIKFSASKGKSIDLITEVETVDSFKDIRKDLKKVLVAYYFMEVVNKITREDEKNEELFNLLKSYIDKLRSQNNLRDLRLDFIYQILTLLGYWPKGRPLPNPDLALEEIVEKKMFVSRVGKKVLSP